MTEKRKKKRRCLSTDLVKTVWDEYVNRFPEGENSAPCCVGFRRSAISDKLLSRSQGTGVIKAAKENANILPLEMAGTQNKRKGNGMAGAIWAGLILQMPFKVWRQTAENIYAKDRKLNRTPWSFFIWERCNLDNVATLMSWKKLVLEPVHTCALRQPVSFRSACE